MIARRLVLAASLLGATRAAAQPAWPSRPVRLLVGFAPGGLADAIARRLAEPLAAELGQPVVVENRPGVGGLLALDVMARAGDGHSFALIFSSFASARFTGQTLPLDLDREVRPVALFGRTPLVLVVTPSLPATDLAGFLALARRSAPPLAYGTPGAGLAQHFAGEALRLRAGIEMVHVPYRGAAPAVNDVVAGQIPAAIASPVAVAELVRAGRLRALAVTGPDRLALMPEVPTVAESGFPGFDVTEWYGLAAPAGTPEAVVVRLNRAVSAAFAVPTMTTWRASAAISGGLGAPVEVAAFVAADVQRLGRIARDAGIRVD